MLDTEDDGSEDSWDQICTNDDDAESTTLGSVRVKTAEQRIDSAESLPPPDDADQAAWLCKASKPADKVVYFPTERKSPDDSPFALPTIARMRRDGQSTDDCAAIVALSSPATARRGQLLLLVAGALFGLGITIAVELVLGLAQRSAARSA